MTAKVKNILQRIAEVRSKVSGVEKDTSVGYGKNSYKATSHDAVLKAIRTAMNEAGIVTYVNGIQQKVTSQSWEESYNGQPKKKFKNFCEVDLHVVFANIDDPKDAITVASIGHGEDQGFLRRDGQGSEDHRRDSLPDKPPGA